MSLFESNPLTDQIVRNSAVESRLRQFREGHQTGLAREIVARADAYAEEHPILGFLLGVRATAEYEAAISYLEETKRETA